MPETSYFSYLDEEKKDSIDVPSIAYTVMADGWPKLHALLGGTQPMRDAGETYLPRGKKEDIALYNLKRDMAYLYNGYRNTVHRIVGKPFSQPVDIRDKEALPERVKALVDDVDGTGQDLTQFMRNVMAAGVIYGLTHILVDFDNVSGEMNTLEEKESGSRAKFIHVLPTQLIGWWPDSGRPQEIRIREFRKERRPGADYVEEVNEYIRTYRTDSWSIHKRIKSEGVEDGWKLVREGEHSFGRVPMATYYVKRTGNLTAEPPFEDLAWVNIAHWQSNADQRNILRFARVPILGLFGFSEDCTAGGLVVGSSAAVRNADTNARIEWAEHGGKAIEAGANDLRQLREEMESLGDQPLREQSGDITASGRAIDESRVHSDIHSWVRSLEGTMKEAVKMAAEWTGDTLPPGFGLNVYDEFSLLSRSDKDMAILDKARSRTDLTRITFLKEAKRRGVLGADVDPETEDAALNSEAPALPFFPAEEPADLGVVEA